ncbi:hypothetical protein [Chroococcidiopsis sp. SAG 2025]|uniref:hypothetical protein n=1 Tax=Chroococcidiopsis sp. SAG 2025 TaxID=171389 RepID=UPI002937110D|nr:hypothetical protein [Chroococcidiopsis sp. SAG 2025]
MTGTILRGSVACFAISSKGIEQKRVAGVHRTIAFEAPPLDTATRGRCKCCPAIENIAVFDNLFSGGGVEDELDEEQAANSSIIANMMMRSKD